MTLEQAIAAYEKYLQVERSFHPIVTEIIRKQLEGFSLFLELEEIDSLTISP